MSILNQEAEEGDDENDFQMEGGHESQIECLKYGPTK